MSPLSCKDLSSLLEYQFKDPHLLEQALTHASQRTEALDSYYERLEFLGDRVLALVMADWLFQLYPSDAEGDLAKRHSYLVSKDALMQVALTMDLGKYLRISSEFKKRMAPNPSSVLSDVCEALIGALYRDGGLEVAAQFIGKQWGPLIEKMTHVPQNAKSVLQELSQSQVKAIPTYRIIKKTGPAHAPTFTVEVCIPDYPPARGSGPSKRQAEQLAAQEMLEKLKA